MTRLQNTGRATAAAESGARLHNKHEHRGSPWLWRLGIQCAAVLGTLLVGIVLVGVAQRAGWIRSGGSGPVEAADDSATYTCPMHPWIRQQGPGRCPVCGMALVRADTGQGAARTVSIDPAARRVLGIQTAEAELGEVHRTIRTVGVLEYDQEQVATIAAYVDGRIEELFAEYVGVSVAKGDNLALIYSPRLFTAQVEFLSSLRSSSLDNLTGGGRLSEIARDNLAELGMTSAQIEALRTSGEAQKRLRITSPIAGTVIAKHKVEGDYVSTGEPIYRVADLSTVWLMLDLYPEDAAVVRFGQRVEAEVQSVPGEVFSGRVAFIEPLVDETTRTIRVRVEMDNRDGRLKPGDYAAARIRAPVMPRPLIYDPELAGKWISPMHPQIVRDEPGTCPICGMALVPASSLGLAEAPLPEQEVITVPRSAVLMAGDNSVVYVETKPGTFEMRRVTLGPLTDSRAVILSGVEPGESVATHGNFLIDSQMQLSGNPSLIDPGRATPEAAGEPPTAPAPPATAPQQSTHQH